MCRLAEKDPGHAGRVHHESGAALPTLPHLYHGRSCPGPLKSPNIFEDFMYFMGFLKLDSDFYFLKFLDPDYDLNNYKPLDPL